MIDITSGSGVLDRYLAERYAQVPGMSSRFAAAICGHLIQEQTRLGIAGDIAEVGVYEGRFFIALALGLQTNERALALDLFSWPDEGVLRRFLEHCAAAGLDGDRIAVVQANSGAVSADDLRERHVGHVRFAHLDADHTPSALRQDLELVQEVLHRDGIVCVDDMMHPSYPLLVTAVLEHLKSHDDMRVFAIVDREDILAAGKFLLCREHMSATYTTSLLHAYSQFRFRINADVGTHHAIVLTPQPMAMDVWGPE